MVYADAVKKLAHVDKSEKKRYNPQYGSIVLVEFPFLQRSFDTPLLQQEDDPMKRLSDEEKARLQIKIEQERANRTHRIDGKPPVSSGRIMGEVFIGYGGGLIGGIFVNLLAIGFIERTDLVGFSGFCIGNILGSTIGVYTVGNIGGETGSLLATLGGSILGLGVGVAILTIGAILTINVTTDFEGLAIVGMVVSYLAPTISATIGFNLTCRCRSPKKQEKE